MDSKQSTEKSRVRRGVVAGVGGGYEWGVVRRFSWQRVVKSQGFRTNFGR